jgi:hypothetical protein
MRLPRIPDTRIRKRGPIILVDYFLPLALSSQSEGKSGAEQADGVVAQTEGYGG